MKISEIVVPFTGNVNPNKNLKYGAEVIPMQPYIDRKQMSGQRMALQHDIDAFTNGFIIAALWATTDDDGNPLDDNYEIDDISDETLIEIIKQCKDFERKYHNLFNSMSDEQAGHDFFLTREGHGAGFWDRGLGKVGEVLTQASKTYPELNLYVGDDGKIYNQ